jgi:hypothetical protein
MLLYPPFHLVDSKGDDHNLGYSFFTDAPWGLGARGSVNVKLLLLQMFVTLLVGGGLLVLYKTEKASSEQPEPDDNP